MSDAYKKLRAPKYQKLRYNCFKKPGCLITTDGREN